jgi:hypothetical protein
MPTRNSSNQPIAYPLLTEDISVDILVSTTRKSALHLSPKQDKHEISNLVSDILTEQETPLFYQHKIRVRKYELF